MTNLRKEYEAQGYDFYENPPLTAVPSFIGKFQPDAIAVRGNEGVVIEVKPNTVKPDALNYIAERFAGQNKWSFRVFFYDAKEEPVKEADTEIINLEELLGRVAWLRDQGEYEGALLMGWAVLESIVRSKSGSTAARQTGSIQIAERLEHLGVVSGDQAKMLRQSAVIRNSVAHGRFDIRPGTGSIDVVLDVAESVGQRRTKLPDG